MTENSGPLPHLKSPQTQRAARQGNRRLGGASGEEIPEESSFNTMDEDIRKKGILYIQQQRFGKKWKKVWSVIYRESACSISRMEFFECKDNAVSMDKPDKTLRKQENKKVIRLSDCIRVSEVEIEGCPKDCGPFLVETTEKLYIFAAENTVLEDWIQKLCEIAFPMNWNEHGMAKRGSVQRGSSRGDSEESAMEENSLYGRGEDHDFVHYSIITIQDALTKHYSRVAQVTMRAEFKDGCGLNKASRKYRATKDFKVAVRKTEASERCRLRGSFILRADRNSLVLMESKSGEMLWTWPYRYLRRFGRDKVTFSFEAGRRCDTGEGNFEFETKQGNNLFHAVESAINLQKNTFPPHRQVSEGPDVEPTPRPPVTKDSSVYSTISDALMRDRPAVVQQGTRCRLDQPTDKVLTGVKSLTLDTRPAPQKHQVKTISSCPLINSEDLTYSQISMFQDQVEQEEPKQVPPTAHSRHGFSDDYSLPFDTIGQNLMANFLMVQQPIAGDSGSVRDNRADGAQTLDPIYDSIDEMNTRPAVEGKSRGPKPNQTQVEHIYDEPEGCAAMVTEVRGPISLYDEPEEVKGYAWKFQALSVDPSGHEYPYNPHIDDYAVPKPPKRAFPDPKEDQPKEEDDSPYDNVMSKMTSRRNR